MRIGIDATPLIKPAGGIPRYVTELVAALAELHPEDEIHLLSDQPGLHLDTRLQEPSNVVYDPPVRSQFFGKWWSLGLPLELKRRRIDVFHGTDFAVPYLPFTPAVMTVHDLSPWKPEPIQPPGSDRVRSRAPKLFGLARRILTPTHAVARELSAQFGIPERKIDAVWHGARKFPRRRATAAVMERLRELGVQPPYFLYVGSREPRKNLPFLETVIAEVRRAHPGVLLAEVGPGAVETEAADGVVRLGEASEEDLAALLSGAAGFLYPSLYEGFGLPVVEAMQAGTPVLASTDAALAEAAGGAAEHLDPENREEWVDAVGRLVSDQKWAAELQARGLERAAELTWERTADKTRAVYDRAIRGG